MKQAPFPFSYFVNTITPKRVFQGRKALSKGQIGLIFIFITALMLVPITINLVRATRFQLVDVMPTMFKQVDSEVLAALQATDFKDGRLQVSGSRVINSQGTVGFNLSQEEMASLKNGLSFGETSMWLKDQAGYDFKVQYTKDFSPTAFTSVTELKEAIGSQWLIQNRAFVAFTMITMSGSLILVSNLILVFGGAFFVWLTKKKSVFVNKNVSGIVKLSAEWTGVKYLFWGVNRGVLF